MQSFDVLKETARLVSENSRLLLEAESLKRAGELEGAVRLFDRLIEVQERLLGIALDAQDGDDTTLYAGWLVNSLTMAADLLQSLGRDDDGNAYRDRAGVITTAHLDEAGAADLERRRAAAFISEGRFNEALVAFATARDFAERQGDALLRVRISIDRADLFQWLGDFARAREELAEARELLASLVPGQAPSMQDMLSDLLGAMAAIQSGSTSASDPVRTAELARAGMEVDYFGGLVARYCGEYDEAERLLEKVRPQYAQAGVEEGIVYQLAAIRADRRQFADALAITEQLEPAFRAPGDLRRKLAAVLRVKAQALVGLDRAPEAVAVLEEALEDLGAYRDPDLEWRVAWQLGVARREAGDEAAALDAFVQAVGTVDRMRTGSLGYRLDSTYLADKLPLFDEAIRLAARRGDADRVIEFIGRIKARGLALAMRAPVAADDASSDEERRLDEISQRVDALEFEGYQKGWTDELEAEFDRLQAERATVVERLRYSDPRWRALSEPPQLDLDALSEELVRRDQAVLELYTAGKDVVCVLLSGGERSVDSIALSDDAQHALQKLVRYLETGDRKGVEAVDMRVEASAFIPAALLDQALEATSMIVVPNGVLHLVPWAGLTYRGERLFERIAVGVAPNLASVLPLGQEAAAAPRVALIGDPDYRAYPDLDDLTEAGPEIRDIAALCKKDDRLVDEPIVGPAADEAAFWRLAENDRAVGAILHAVCHGTLEVDEPLASGLLFTHGKADAGEIARSRMPYDEAVLSACSTGWRPQAVGDVELHGDDILGIPGAFLEAGVRALVVSIPPADDEAARDFAVRYHRERSEHPPLIAMRETLKGMLEDTPHPPHRWVGFTLYGCA